MSSKKRKKKVVVPGDLVSLDTEVGGVLTGVVLTHHDDVSKFSFFDKFNQGPGVSIHWADNQMTAHWSYDAIEIAMKQTRMKIVCNSHNG